MCLFIDDTVHKTFLPKSRVRLAPFVTERPILVWKRLSTWSVLLGGSHYQGKEHIGNAPYRCDRYYDGKLVTSKFSFGSSHGGRYKSNIEAGLHAYRSAGGWLSTHDEFFPAIIPAGSQVYLGKGNEIAANQLIVYKDMAALIAVHGQPDKGTKVQTARETFLKDI